MLEEKRTLLYLYSELYERVYSQIDKEVYTRVINYMIQAKKIDFYGTGTNYFELESACLKLNSLGFRAQAFNTINETYADKSNPKDTLSFVVSHTEKNAAMIDTPYYLRKHRFNVIGISGNEDPTLEIVCNHCLMISTISQYHLLLPYSVSLHYILDILILTLSTRVKNNMLSY